MSDLRSLLDPPESVGGATIRRPSRDLVRWSHRRPETGYGSPMFKRACRIIAEYGQINHREPRALRALWLRMRAGSPLLVWYRLCLPRFRIQLSASAAGRMIGEHLAIRERGRWKYRRAQGVLPLPAEFSEYLRGGHRQAVRTNVAHARTAGLTVKCSTVEAWTPSAGDIRAAYIGPGPIERWMALGPDGNVVADSILSVDNDVALLHGLVSHVPNGRWFLHTVIVERLCGSCSFLLINSDDAYLIGAGNQHFQRLLGYKIGCLRPCRAAPVVLQRAPRGKFEGGQRPDEDLEAQIAG